MNMKFIKIKKEISAPRCKLRTCCSIISTRLFFSIHFRNHFPIFFDLNYRFIIFSGIMLKVYNKKEKIFYNIECNTMYKASRQFYQLKEITITLLLLTTLPYDTRENRTLLSVWRGLTLQTGTKKRLSLRYCGMLLQQEQVSIKIRLRCCCALPPGKKVVVDS